MPSKKKQTTGPTTTAAEISFTVQSAPRFRIAVQGVVQETDVYPENDSFTVLPASAPGEWAFKLCKYGRKERIFRIRLPEAAASAVRTSKTGD